MHLLTAAILLFFAFNAVASDTLKPASYADTCALNGNIPDLVTYKTPLGGFICGNNALNTPEKAQKYFWNDSARTLTAVAFWFGQKQQAVFPGNIRAKVYRAHPLTGSPTLLLGESTLESVGNIDTSDQLSVLSFTNSILLPDTFFVALDLSLLSPGDSIGLLSTRDGCYSGEQLAWEKDSAGAWTPLNDGTAITSWGLDIDMAIFPVGDFGLHTGMSIPQRKSTSVFPNPAREKIFVDLQNEPGSFFCVELFDLQGQVQYKKFFHVKARIEIETMLFNPGAYFLTVKSEKLNSVQKIMILH